MTSLPSCAGCLGTLQCWICTGDGCHRCETSGACHLCELPRLQQSLLHQLVPRQPTPAEGLLRR